MGARRTIEKKRTPTRGAPVVRGVLRAAILELGRMGYRGLRIDDVALRAKVHKTTIYRRFPTKASLVQAAIQSAVEDTMTLTDTGSFGGDLRLVAYGFLAFSVSATGRALIRMVMTEGTDGELRKIVDAVRKTKETVPRQVVSRALARGDIRKGVDPQLLLSTLVGSLHHSIFVLSEVPSKRRVDALVDLLLHGASARCAGPSRS